MVEFGSVSTSQRVGEIIVLSASGVDKHSFIQSICPALFFNEQDILLGDLTISTDLSVFFYGFSTEDDFSILDWCLFARKMLGMIILFKWNDRSSFEHAKSLARFVEMHFRAPVLIAADTDTISLSVPPKILLSGLVLQNFSRFVFYNSADKKSIRQVFTILIDMLIQYCDERG
jgi:signal recognition particle receptor subunit beta